VTTSTETVQVLHEGSDVSRLKDEFDNGKEYYALQGKTILLPGNPAFRPSPELLGWHNDNRYRA
jgi:putative restriction endonuclease